MSGNYDINSKKVEISEDFKNDRLFHYSFSSDEGKSIAYLMSVPDDLMKHYSPDRYEQQKQDSITENAYDFIVNCDNIRAVLAGHLHENFEGMLTDGSVQLVTGRSTVREIFFD